MIFFFLFIIIVRVCWSSEDGLALIAMKKMSWNSRRMVKRYLPSLWFRVCTTSKTNGKTSRRLSVLWSEDKKKKVKEKESLHRLTIDHDQWWSNQLTLTHSSSDDDADEIQWTSMIDRWASDPSSIRFSSDFIRTFGACFVFQRRNRRFVPRKVLFSLIMVFFCGCCLGPGTSYWGCCPGHFEKGSFDWK